MDLERLISWDGTPEESVAAEELLATAADATAIAADSNRALADTIEKLRLAKRALALVRYYGDSDMAAAEAEKLGAMDDEAFSRHLALLACRQPPRATILPPPPKATNLPDPPRVIDPTDRITAASVQDDVTDYLDAIWETPLDNHLPEQSTASREPKTGVQAEIAEYLSHYLGDRSGDACDD